MNIQKTQSAAIELEEVFSEISNPAQPIQDLHHSLLPYIESAKNQLIQKPLKEGEIPGDFQLQEGMLADYPDYEKQYVKFKVALRGGYTPEELELLDLMKNL